MIEKFKEDADYSLLTETKQFLESKDTAELVRIANETGLSYHWLDKIRRSQILQPSVNRVQYIHDTYIKKEKKGKYKK